MRSPTTLDIIMILVSCVALIVLLTLAIYTWVKWHKRQVLLLVTTGRENQFVSVEGGPYAIHQATHLNPFGTDSPNLSGSRTLLSDDVLPKQPAINHSFHTQDIVYHADAERDPDKLLAGDIVHHASEPFASSNQNDQLGRPNGVRRWSESTARRESGQRDVATHSHNFNTYL